LRQQRKLAVHLLGVAWRRMFSQIVIFLGGFTP
jgi:hypothetical protein